jgi:holo-[acyl-carrier protein] synthase
MITLISMTTGIGLDLVEKERIARAVSLWGKRILSRLFTERELLECGRKHDRTGSLAARFAAKEAAFKALGTGWSDGVGWKDVEIINAPGGRPEIIFHGGALERMGGRRALVSLTHDSRTAAAVVVISTEEG